MPSSTLQNLKNQLLGNPETFKEYLRLCFEEPVWPPKHTPLALAIAANPLPPLDAKSEPASTEPAPTLDNPVPYWQRWTHKYASNTNATITAKYI